jgi:hypothetical protein
MQVIYKYRAICIWPSNFGQNKSWRIILNLNKLYTEYNMEMWLKEKTMAFYGKMPSYYKILISDFIFV